MVRRSDHLHQMRVFSAVAQQGNFAKAATLKHLPASSVSKTLGQLEKRLKVTLFRRTTRHMVLTDEGHQYLRMVQRVLRDIELSEDRLRTGDEVRGTMHVTAPVAFSERFLSAYMPSFCKKYPYEVTRKAIEVMTPILKSLPNQVKVTGHVASGGIYQTQTYGKWDLSTDRANIVRRVMEEFGMPSERFHSVVGKGESQPLFPNDPYLSANQRISILLMKEEPPVPVELRP